MSKNGTVMGGIKDGVWKREISTTGGGVVTISDNTSTGGGGGWGGTITIPNTKVVGGWIPVGIPPASTVPNIKIGEQARITKHCDFVAGTIVKVLAIDSFLSGRVFGVLHYRCTYDGIHTFLIHYANLEPINGLQIMKDKVKRK